jgi:hypothetical protein
LSGDPTPSGVDKNVIKTSGLKGEIENSLHTERDEHSVLGRAVGVARDLLQGEVHGLREKQERAQSNDEIAKIAVDTIAAIPKLHIIAAGAVRALALVDPSEGFNKNVVSGVTNFAEGSALNKVSHLSAEGVHGLFTSGAAMGAIRTGFDENNWCNKDGRFDAISAAQHIGTGALAGAFFNVPAGLASSRVALHLGAENAASTASTRFLSSITSGYVSGSVYGGMDAIVAGGSAKDVLSAMNTGGVTGALSGGLVHGFSGLIGERNSVRIDFKPPQEMHASSRLDEPVRELEPPPLIGFTHRAEMEHVYDQFAYRPKPRPDFVELNARMTPILRYATAEVPKVRAGNLNKSWDSEAAFNRDLVTEKVDMAVYGARGTNSQRLPVEIHVPVKYDAQVIKPLRELRSLAGAELPIANKSDDMLGYLYRVLNRQDLQPYLERRSPEVQQKLHDDFAQMTQEQRSLTSKILSARQAFINHPHKLALLPEDVLPYLEQSNNVQKVVITDQNWAHDTWMRQNKDAAYFDPNFTAAATAEHATGTITFYKGQRPDPERPQTTNTFSDLFNHEDTHLMIGFKPVYDAAHALDSQHYEEPAFSITAYAKLNDEEDRAESRTAFLQPDPTGFWTLSKEAPLRTAVLARAESEYLDKFMYEGHPYEQPISDRIVHVEKYVNPIARAQAIGHLVSGDQTRVALAARVLGTIGSKEDIPELERVARLDGRAQLYLNRMNEIEKGLLPKSHEQQTAEVQLAHNPKSPYNIAAREAFESVVKLSADNDTGRLQGLVKRAVTDPQMRHLAVEKMQDGTFGVKGVEYANMLRNFGNRQNVSAIVREIERTHDPEIKSIGFAEVMRLSSNEPASQRHIANKMFHEQPALADDALRVLMDLDAQRLPK